MTGTPHFSNNELKCKCGCGCAEMDSKFLDRLEDLRVAYDAPIYLTSAFRCPGYNIKKSNTGSTGPHTTGHAVDILISGDEAYKIVLLAMQIGFSGIGLKQRGPHEHRFIHLDDLSFPRYPRPRIWTY